MEILVFCGILVVFTVIVLGLFWLAHESFSGGRKLQHWYIMGQISAKQRKRHMESLKKNGPAPIMHDPSSNP
jgi:hypothetical protein